MNAKYTDFNTAPELAVRLLEKNAKKGKEHMENFEADMLNGGKIEPTITPEAEEQKLVEEAVAKMRGYK